jgi:hypothetical protein
VHGEGAAETKRDLTVSNLRELVAAVTGGDQAAAQDIWGARSWLSTLNALKPFSTLKVRVGTTNRSMAAISGAWFRMNVHQLWPRGPGAMYFATGD